jgi:hypothetical protein
MVGEPGTAVRRSQGDALTRLVCGGHQALEFVDRRLEVSVAFQAGNRAEAGVYAGHGSGKRALTTPGRLDTRRQTGRRLVHAVIV